MSWPAPRLTTAVPAPLVAIAVIGIGAAVLGIDVSTVGDMGALPDSLPSLGLPGVPFDLETLGIIAPYAFALAVVGLLESLLTAQLVDDITDTRSDKGRESRGQGIAIAVATHNLALGVAGGVLLAAVFFARRVAHVADVTSVIHPTDGRTRIYHVTGELFFASTNELLHCSTTPTTSTPWSST